MVVLSQPILDNPARFQTCKSTSGFFTEIPIIDLSDSNAKKLIIEACKGFGFFKVVNHGVSMEFLNVLEAEAVKFFELPQQEKEKSGSPSSFGYGNKKIGPNGDVGWVEYLLVSCANNELFSEKAILLPGISEKFWCHVKDYVCAVRNLACEVLDMISEELQIIPKDILSGLISGDKSDSLFRLNYYPPCPEIQAVLSGQNLIGFGEHTDPQIISVVKSNNTSGLQICLTDGSWVSVPPDHSSFYFNVGDSLQVMTNGRFKSVKHRVLTNGLKPRVSMIYFGGPPLSEKITPLSSLMEEGEESLYREFTWSEYKKSAYKTRLGDNRLGFFEKRGSII